jgi:hypothetical protein
MKKFAFLLVLFCAVSFSSFAQGFYFDIGLGFGGAITELDGVDVGANMNSSVTKVAVDLGLKAGYGPIAGLPFYVIGEIGGIGHRFQDSSGSIQFNSYLIGPGVIFYPIPLVQLGASAGFSFVANQFDISGYVIEAAKSNGGFAFDVSAALDFGKNNHGFLLGLKYTLAINQLETSVEEKQSAITLILRYAYRHKPA